MALPFRDRLQALETRLGLNLRIFAALFALGSLVAVMLFHDARSTGVRVLVGISIVLWISSAGIQIYGSLKFRHAKRSLNRPES
jgi:hypothetical protein